MTNGTKARPSGPPNRDWRPNTARLLAAQLRENEDRLDAGLVTEERFRVVEFGTWETAKSLGDEMVELVKAALEGPTP